MALLLLGTMALILFYGLPWLIKQAEPERDPVYYLTWQACEKVLWYNLDWKEAKRMDKKQAQRKMNKGIAGYDRKRHMNKGGDQSQTWRGGKPNVFTDRKKQKNKYKARKKVDPNHE